MVVKYSFCLGKVISDDCPLDHLEIVSQHFGLVGKGVNPVGCSLNMPRVLKPPVFDLLAVVRDQSTREVA